MKKNIVRYWLPFVWLLSVAPAVFGLSINAYADQRITWYGQSAFRIITNAGKLIYLDPYKLPANSRPGDLILISHSHFDHFDEKLVASLRKSGTRVIVPETMVVDGYEGMKEGETKKVGEIAITAVPAYNLKSDFHPRSKKWLGYLLVVDGIRIYHAGDTDLIPEMKGINPDIALLPVGGSYTMNVTDAAKAAAILQAKVYIPMHYGSLVGSSDDGRRFAQLIKNARVKVFTPVQ